MTSNFSDTDQRLREAIAHARMASVGDKADFEGQSICDPAELRAALAPHLGGSYFVAGNMERRLLIAQQAGTASWTIADLSGQPHSTRIWPAWTEGRIAVDDPTHWLSTGTILADAINRFERPRILLVSLCHPEYFPLPRFALAISDLARAARTTLMGKVKLLDMQLGASFDDVITQIETWQPDILGVSATFGQHDLLTGVLDKTYGNAHPPLVVAGGSLTARNEKILIEDYPSLLVARGVGEPTIADLVAYWHGDMELADVRGIGYAGSGSGSGHGEGVMMPRYRRTATVANRTQTDIYPELDLLGLTFQRGGVAQIETSRGCTNFCSFCPRGHKGSWAGVTPGSLSWTLAAMREVFSRHPSISRTLYVVDEEYIGRGTGAVERAVAIASEIHGAGFQWESSCRVDQVVRPDQDDDWHLERAAMWRRLAELGLRRMLFGVESGVTSVLERFNKETTGEQNALAIRTLSALGVPTRFTYITFDHLMTPDELQATYDFQARTDLLVRPLPHLPDEEIVRGVRDESFLAEHVAGRPFYTEISYMLVSMECLIGAAYTRQVASRGLTGRTLPAMGRVNADFADWRIGRCSRHAQLWVDRNFALDYTLKSLEKLLDGDPRHAVRRARQVIKDAAFNLLGGMVKMIGAYDIDIERRDALDADLMSMMEYELKALQVRIDETAQAIIPTLPRTSAELLRREWQRWRHTGGWRLMNTSDPCGT